MRRKVLLPPMIMVVLFSPTSSRAEAPGPAPQPVSDSSSAAAKPKKKSRRLWQKTKSVRSDAVYLVTFPGRVTRRGVITTSVFAAGLGGLLLLDQEIGSRVQAQRTDTSSRVETFFEPLGNFQETHLSLLATYVAGKLFHHEPTAETGRALMEAMVFTDVSVTVGKEIFGRKPPRPGLSSDFFEGGRRFPSGHSARAFAIATVLARRHGRVAGWIAYPIATLAGLSRIESDAHWSSDVYAGAALGYLVGRTVVRRRGERASRASWTPWVTPDGRGAGIMLRMPMGNTR